MATVSRVGGAVIGSSGRALVEHERKVGAAIRGTVLEVSLLGLCFPRLLAWPLGAAGSLLGGAGLWRVAQQRVEDRS